MKIINILFGKNGIIINKNEDVTPKTQFRWLIMEEGIRVICVTRYLINLPKIYSTAIHLVLYDSKKWTLKR